MRVFIRTSGWAIWLREFRACVAARSTCHSVSLYCVMTSPVFVAAIFVAIALALVSLALGLIGYVNIWYSGDAGWRESSSGVLAGFVAIVFTAFVVITSAQNQTASDVSTAPATTPIWSNGTMDNAQSASLVDSAEFRTTTTREYKIAEEVGLGLVEQVAKNLGWQTLGEQRRGAAELHKFYEAKTLIGFKDDVTISTRTTARLLIVNVRSASRFGEGDFGTNSRRIEQFLLQLDELVGQYQKQSPGS